MLRLVLVWWLAVSGGAPDPVRDLRLEVRPAGGAGLSEVIVEVWSADGAPRIFRAGASGIAMIPASLVAAADRAVVRSIGYRPRQLGREELARADGGLLIRLEACQVEPAPPAGADGATLLYRRPEPSCSAPEQREEGMVVAVGG